MMLIADHLTLTDVLHCVVRLSSRHFLKLLVMAERIEK